jgi:hypothetical protein
VSIEDRLRDAVQSHAASVDPGPDNWDEIEARMAQATRQRRRRAAFSMLGAAAASTILLAAVVVFREQPVHRVQTTPAGPSVTPAGGNESPDATTTTPPPASTFAYQPLWPFRSADEAKAWQDSSGAGHQPWHLDAGQTALSFTNGYLQISDVDRVIRTTTDDKGGAHVAVGFPTEGGRTGTAAVIHLVRYGDGADAPWEVVGTDDSADFTLTAPHYGATVTSPTVAGGNISGVDESIRVQVRQPSSPAPIGESCCLPAGGTGSPWKTNVTFTGATDPVRTIVASTGGHLLAVERFAVTGVRPH